MLQRIYGTSRSTQKDLDSYLQRIEEAEKRDHRKLGKEMNFFHFREESPGAVFWHEKGWILFQNLVDYMRTKQKRAGYKKTRCGSLHIGQAALVTPNVVKRARFAEKQSALSRFENPKND